MSAYTSFTKQNPKIRLVEPFRLQLPDYYYYYYTLYHNIIIIYYHHSVEHLVTYERIGYFLGW